MDLASDAKPPERRVLIVGLGNPGPEYRDTRHNLGFRVLDELAARLGVAFAREKYAGLFAEGRAADARIALLKPMTYMNRSGESVCQAVRYCISGLENLLVVTDDVNLPLGRLRLRASGSAGGHNGLKSIIDHLGTNAFPRLRIGVGIGKDDGDLTRHVLGRFTPEENAVVERAVLKGADAVLVYAQYGLQAAMDRFNARQTPEEKGSQEAQDGSARQEKV